jgi:hypothetical protein
VVVFHAADAEQAERFMAADPAVAAGVMHAVLYPFHVALLATGPGPA